MLMTDEEIRDARSRGLGLEPFSEPCLQGSSYDARVGGRAIIGGEDREIDVGREGCLTVKPGEFVLILTLECFKLPMDIAGHIGVRSYFTRKGFVVLAGLQIDPGFEGHLVIGGYNAAPRRLTLDYEAPFLTVEFHKLSHPAKTQPPRSREQLDGLIPRMDKDYLRTLETQSLSDVATELQILTKNVGAMQNQLRVFYAPILVGTLLAVIGFGLAALQK